MLNPFNLFRKKEVGVPLKISDELILYLPIQNRNIYQHDMLWELHNSYQVEHFNYLQFDDDPKFVQKGIIKLIEKFKPIIIHMQIQRSNAITAKFLKKIKQNYPKIILSHWSGDAQYNKNFVECSKIADFTFFASYKNVIEFREMGINAFYLQHSFESKTSKNLYIEKEYDVVYLGGRYKGTDKDNVRFNLIKAASQRNLKIWGRGWEEIEANPYVHIQSPEVNEIYNKARIGLNINHWHDHNMNQSDRAYMIMATGTFCLSYYHPDLEYILGPDGKYTRYFTTEEQLLELIDYYLENEKEREEIARRGYDFVHKFNTHEDRAHELSRYWKNKNVLSLSNFKSETLKLNDKLLNVLLDELKKFKSVLEMSESGNNLAPLIADKLNLIMPMAVVDRNEAKGAEGIKLFREHPGAVPFPGGIFECVLVNLADKEKNEQMIILNEALRLSPSRIVIIHNEDFIDNRAQEIYKDNYIVSVIRTLNEY